MSPCEDCALRLFNTKHHNLEGIGNTAYGNVIVVPNVDYDAYKKGNMSFSKQVEIIQECIASTGEVDILDYVYILPLIRCNTTVKCEINNDIYKLCSRHFIKDRFKYNFRNFLFLGEAARRLTTINIKDYISYVFRDVFGNNYNVNYAPFVKYVHEQRFEDFKSYLIKWYNLVVHDYNNFDKIISI